MISLRGLRLRWRALFRRGATERELDDEIRLHLDLETERLVRDGMPATEARRRARVAFGGLEDVREAHRDARGVRWVQDVLADGRFALRILRRNPLLSGAAIVTLALGIGANTAIFSAVNAVILRPLPFPHPDRLVMLSEDNPEKGWRRETAAPANYLDWKERVHAFADVAAYTPGGGSTIGISGAPQRVRVRSVTGNYFSLLGVRPEAGRLFTEAETWNTAPPVIVISHQLAQQAYGGAAAAVGRTVPIDGTRSQIVGVLPERFSFAADTEDVWRPMRWDPASRSKTFFRRAHFVRVLARLQAGITPREADAQFQVVVRQLQTEYPETNRMMGADLVPLQEFLIGDVRPALVLLQAAVGLLLLIACANVGNLLLVQAADREREASLRLTLGAGHGRLIRQALTESLVLSLLGGAVGVVVGWWGTRVLAVLQPNGMLPVANVPVDRWVLATTLLLTLLTGLLFGIAPAAWSARRVPAEVLKESGRTGTGPRLRRWGDTLVTAEVALALVLTVGAGLLIHSFRTLVREDPGIDPRGVLAVGVSLPAGYYDSTAQQLAFFDALRTQAAALPGVTGAGFGIVPPFGGVAYTSDFHVAGRPRNDYGTEVGHDYVTPEYFPMLRIPLLAGRNFTAADRVGSIPVTIINESLARKYFADQDPLGQRITFDKFPDSTSVWRTIVGVVGDVRQQGLAEPPAIEAYDPASQQINSYMTLLVRSRGDVAAPVPAIRRIIARLDASIAPVQVRSLEQLEARTIAGQRFIMILLGVFAVTGLVLAVIGVYGVMAQLGRRRSREMGIRLALGARGSQVQWLVVRHGVRLVGAGLGIGLAVALGATRLMQALLYGVAPDDPVTFVSVVAVLALTALSASWLPAFRASRADPAGALRAE